MLSIKTAWFEFTESNSPRMPWVSKMIEDWKGGGYLYIFEQNEIALNHYCCPLLKDNAYFIHKKYMKVGEKK